MSNLYTIIKQKSSGLTKRAAIPLDEDHLDVYQTKDMLLTATLSYFVVILGFSVKQTKTLKHAIKNQIHQQPNLMVTTPANMIIVDTAQYHMQFKIK